MGSMISLDNKVVVITGAGSGIGRALAIQAARHGARIALSDVDEVGLAETARLSGAWTVRTDRLDVRDRAAVAAYAMSVADEFGTVNVVINNAGVALTGNVADVTYADFEWIIDIDFWGVVHGTKEFLPYLIASGDGHIVNVSSLFGLLSIPGQSAYNAAKFAVRGFTEALRQEMLVAGHPVTVSCVHPGGIKTAIARNARASEGEDQAVLAEFFDRKLARMTAEDAARVILAGMVRGRPKIVVGLDAKVLDLFVKLFGARYQGIVASVTKRMMPKAASSQPRNVRHVAYRQPFDSVPHRNARSR
jgi:NAD(P)-dependent dehydrogenase (short-subunit alcohol dehydrogenase family)